MPKCAINFATQGMFVSHAFMPKVGPTYALCERPAASRRRACRRDHKRPDRLEDDLDRRRLKMRQRLDDFREFRVRRSFTDTPLEGWLRSTAWTRSRLPAMTHMCCNTTARQAVHHRVPAGRDGDADAAELGW
jgi:hypothetical protein